MTLCYWVHVVDCYTIIVGECDCYYTVLVGACSYVLYGVNVGEGGVHVVQQKPSGQKSL